MKIMMFACLALALVAVVGYVLMGVGIIKPGNLMETEGMPAFYYVIPAGYAVIGFLVLLKKRRVWITLAIINAFTIVVFYAKYATQSDVMLSDPGLITKIAQILMEAGLIYLIIKSKPEKSVVSPR